MRVISANGALPFCCAKMQNDYYSKTNKNVKTTKQNVKREPTFPQEQLICKNYQPTFQRKWLEHKSWGAVVDPITKEVSFKLFTFPDVKQVEVVVHKAQTNAEKIFNLINRGKGVFETENKIPQTEVSNGDRYSYRITKADGSIDTVKDPYSFRQEEILGDSTIYDHSLYQWNDNNWYDKSNTKRISRLANKENNLTSLREANIYEIHIGTLMENGTFEKAKEKLKYIEEQGYNTIEIMPVENTYSFNLGYDGVDKFAPSHIYGNPDELKSLIDAAHGQGLNVIIDMVPNHLGTDGASLHRTGPYLNGGNAFGSAFNFEHENSRYVRDFIINAALNWIDNYHCDGLRLDATKHMGSDYTMQQLAAEVHYHKPDAFLIAEDFRMYDQNIRDSLLKPLPVDSSENEHLYTIEHIDKNIDMIDASGGIYRIPAEALQLKRFGYDSEWDCFTSEQIRRNLFGNFNYHDNISENVDLSEIHDSVLSGQNRVKYIESHDSMCEFCGNRYISKAMVPLLNLHKAVILSKEDVNRAEDFEKLKHGRDGIKEITIQKAYLTAEKLVEALETGVFEKNGMKDKSDKEFMAYLKDNYDINPSSEITYNKLESSLDRCFNKMKSEYGRLYSIPGPKMIFQGGEKLDITPFRFFRLASYDPETDARNLTIEKGYEYGENALKASTLGHINYSQKWQDKNNKFHQLMFDLNMLNKQNPAIRTGYVIGSDAVLHNDPSKLLAEHFKDENSGNEIFTVTNYKNENYPEYKIHFPKGRWQEILNTDDIKYAGSGDYQNPNIISNRKKNTSPIKIAANTTIIFKRVDN